MRIFNNIILSILLLFAVTLSAQETKQKPNIVLIMADDIGQGDVGFYHTLRTGKKASIPTPNLDKLASQGMIFTDAHSPASLCAPTCFSMLTIKSI